MRWRFSRRTRICSGTDWVSEFAELAFTRTILVVNCHPPGVCSLTFRLLQGGLSAGEGNSGGVQAVPLRDLAGITAVVNDAVVLVDEHDLGRIGASFCVREHSVGDDDDQITRVDVVGGGSVDADLPASAFPGDGVRGQAGPVGDGDGGD